MKHAKGKATEGRKEGRKEGCLRRVRSFVSFCPSRHGFVHFTASSIYASPCCPSCSALSTPFIHSSIHPFIRSFVVGAARASERASVSVVCYGTLPYVLAHAAAAGYLS